MCITCTCDKGILKKSKNIQTFCIYECRVLYVQQKYPNQRMWCTLM